MLPWSIGDGQEEDEVEEILSTDEDGFFTDQDDSRDRIDEDLNAALPQRHEEEEEDNNDHDSTFRDSSLVTEIAEDDLFSYASNESSGEVPEGEAEAQTPTNAREGESTYTFLS